MSATFTGAHRRIIYRSGTNNAWIQIPRFWAGYVTGLFNAAPRKVNIDMDEQGILTIRPIYGEEAKDRHANLHKATCYKIQCPICKDDAQYSEKRLCKHLVAIHKIDQDIVPKMIGDLPRMGDKEVLTCPPVTRSPQ